MVRCRLDIDPSLPWALEPRCAPSEPMDQQDRLIGGVVQVADDLLHQDVDQALLGGCIGRRRVPSRGQIVSKFE